MENTKPAINFDDTEAFMGALEKIRRGGSVLKAGQGRVTKPAPIEGKPLPAYPILHNS